MAFLESREKMDAVTTDVKTTKCFFCQPVARWNSFLMSPKSQTSPKPEGVGQLLIASHRVPNPQWAHTQPSQNHSHTFSLPSSHRRAQAPPLHSQRLAPGPRGHTGCHWVTDDSAPQSVCHQPAASPNALEGSVPFRKGWLTTVNLAKKSNCLAFKQSTPRLREKSEKHSVPIAQGWFFMETLGRTWGKWVRNNTKIVCICWGINNHLDHLKSQTHPWGEYCLACCDVTAHPGLLVPLLRSSFYHLVLHLVKAM